MKRLFFFFTIFLISCFPFASPAQDAGNDSDGKKGGKGFHFGFFVGSLFANNYTANLYDGYGLDADGNKNDFPNSAMNRKIHFEYGGDNGQSDRIAPALGVNHTDWTFDNSDMPVNMHYTPSIFVGLQTRYCASNKDAILFNVNGTKLTVNGNFTITTTAPTVGTTQYPTNIRTFPIIGGEQRMILQLGYQRILGDNDKLNCFVEGGLSFTMVKFNKNVIQINDLLIDLTTYYNYQGYVDYRAKNLTGVSFGAFAGFGLNLSLSKKWTVQLVYNPSYENINIGIAPALKLQNALGLRAYYNL
ncbi:MAG TPA: hypothetical protein VGO45_02625 [Bacteroidia bacterium]|jgi:hypothetical protein|nr:hypothetical protein [Bacteroidia bacterium]